MPVVITAYEVPSGSVATFAAPVHGHHQRYRALAPDATFAYIDVAEFGSADEADAAVRTARAGTHRAHAGSYEVFHTGDRPTPAPTDGGSQLVFVNCLSVEAGQEDAAFERWLRVNEYMVDKPGYLSHRLHRRSRADAAFGFVNVVRWESPEAWAAAHDDGFRALTAGPLPFVATPTLCRPVAVDVSAVPR